MTHELGFITSDILVNVEEAIFSRIAFLMPSSREEEEERESDYNTENRWTVAAILSLKVEGGKTEKQVADDSELLVMSGLSDVSRYLRRRRSWYR